MSPVAPPDRWEGVDQRREDHRTVGARAWCHNDRTWCYPHIKCDCCMYALGFEKKWVKGDEVIDGD